MNKFITIALFALCATMASGQILTGYPYNVYASDLVSQQIGQAGGAASSSASSSSSSSAANNALLAQNQRLVSPLSYGGYSPLSAQYLNGWPSPIGAVGAYGAYPYGPVGPVGPFGPSGPFGPVGPGLIF